MKDEKESQKYFNEPIQSKEKAAILAQAKKLYLEKKRKVPFVDILLGLISKEKWPQQLYNNFFHSYIFWE